MTAFEFEPESAPLPRWMGPYSPARGARCGLRVTQGQLGAWLQTEEFEEFWLVEDGHHARQLRDLVVRRWGGGRLLFLPTGHIVKPLQENDEVGKRVLVGRFRGALVLRSPDGPTLDLAWPGLTPGTPWPGPKTLGLEAVIAQDGALDCRWYHPSPWGRDQVEARLRERDATLADGFRRCRPSEPAGRVRITANGHVTTNRHERDGSWTCLYVGWIDPRTWPSWDHWIKQE